MPRLCLCVLCAVTAAVVAALLLGASSPAVAQEKPVSFITDVVPILKDANCFGCHESKKKAGKYDMTTFEKLFAGGANGDPIVAGKPADSEFYTLLVTAEDRRMPPRDKGDAVPKEKAAVIERWIKQGAKIDAGLDPKADIGKELRARWKPPAPPAKYPFPAIVNALAFTPDGKAVVVGGHHEIAVWSLDGEPKLVKRLHTRAERAYGIAFLPDGKLVVAGGRPGQEGDVRVYDLGAKPAKSDGGVEFLDGVGDPKVMLKLLAETDDSVLCLAVSADGKRVAAGGCDRAIRVWDLSGGLASAKLEQTVENHADWVLGVALSPDGKHLFSSGRDKMVKVWDLAAKESVLTFAEHQNVAYGVAANKDGTLGFSVGADRQLRSWKPTGDGKQVKNAGGHSEDVFKLVGNGTVLATGSGDKTVRLWDAATLAGTKTLTGLTDHVFAVAISPDGILVAGGSYDGEVRVWKVADGTPVTGFNASPGQPTKFVPPPPKKK